MTRQPYYQHENTSYKTFCSVKSIFKDNWEEFLRVREVRDIEKQEVEKMLQCRDLEKGYFVYYCKNCNKEVTVPFGCNSRICSSCSKRYTDEWANNLAGKIIPKIEHKHLVFSLPEILWNFIRNNKELQKLLMDTAADTVKEMFSKTLNQEVETGIISALHPFGRDLVFKPHVHLIATNGGYTQEGKFLRIRYISYDSLHRKWQYNFLTKLKQFVTKNVIDYCFDKYPRGFAAYVRPKAIYSNKHLARYVGRYIRHPAIANSRILSYDGKTVLFYYKDHKLKKTIYKRMKVFDFISATIQHIPDKNFKLVRYYGLYSRKNKNKLKILNSLSVSRQKVLSNSKEKPVFYCPYCCEKMIFIEYCKKPP